MRFGRCVARVFFAVGLNDQVGFDTGQAESRAEDNSLKTSATAQCNVNLPVRESRSSIDDDAIEGQSLALVDGDGPRKLQRILGKRAEDVFLYFFRFFID